MEHPIIWMGPGLQPPLRGMLATILSGLSPCRDQAVSTNPGGGVQGWLLDSACHSMTSQVGVACVVAWAVAIAYDPGHFPPWATKKDPLQWAQWVLLWLHSCWVGSADLDGMIFTQLEGRTSSRTSLSVKVVSSSIICWSSNTHSAKWWHSLGIGSWAFSTQCWKVFT